MEELPFDLQLSQASLQDFVDCRRRFQLRHVLHQAWPALAVEPALENEHHLQQGAILHRMIQQHLLGVPAARLAQMTAALPANADLARWWRNYTASAPISADQADGRHVELVLSTSLADYLLVAKYDLVVLAPGDQALIFDWKTARRRPARAWLADRLQTRVYPFVLVEAGAYLNAGRPIAADQVQMVYWFADYPDQPERFAYSAEQHEENRRYLLALVDEMERLAENKAVWPLTPVTERCRFCVYRSLCDRGLRAGHLDELEDEAAGDGDWALDIDFEQIAEIAY